MSTVMPPQAVILCGGLGTRLGPLTARCPKPLLPVADLPFLEILIFELVRQGTQRILLLAAFEVAQIEAFARGLPARLPRPAQISVARESQPAGTSGALWQARDQLDERFLLLNGDSWFDVLVADVAAAQLARPRLLGALALRLVADGGRYGCVQLADGMLTGFEERGAASGPALINGGVYCFDKKILQYLVPNGSLEREVLPRLAVQGALAGIERSNFFIDIGVPSDFSMAQSLVPAQRRRPAIFFTGTAVLNAGRACAGGAARPEWTAGAEVALRLVNASGWYAFVIAKQNRSNDGCSGADRCFSLPEHLILHLDKYGAHIDDCCSCTRGFSDSESIFFGTPNIRSDIHDTILKLKYDWPIDLNNSVVIVDCEADYISLINYGVRSVLLDSHDISNLVKKILENRIIF